MICTDPVRLDEDWVLMNTDMMADALARGERVFLPHVMDPGDDVLGCYESSEAALFGLDSEMDEIVSVDFVGYEEVQCISVDDDEHLYLTDGMIPTHNTSNIVFLKSTDDSMLDTLQKMSGTKHESYIDSKTVTSDVAKLAMKNEGKISYTMSTREVPVVAYNDMAFLSERNSIVFRAGDSPIWNTNQTILPMSWRLFSFTITHPGHEYTLQTIPTLSSARDFDVRKNQPNFNEMLDKRVRQAMAVKEAREAYQKAYGYSDYEIEQLDPDTYADAIMEIVNTRIREESIREQGVKSDKDVVKMADKMDPNEIPTMAGEGVSKGAERNVEQEAATREQKAKEDMRDAKRFAGGQLASSDLVGHAGVVDTYNKYIIQAFLECRGAFANDPNFRVRNNSLYASDNKVEYIVAEVSDQEALRKINEAAKEQGQRTYSSSDLKESDMSALGKYRVTQTFVRRLSNMETWQGIADGEFESAMARIMREA